MAVVEILIDDPWGRYKAGDKADILDYTARPPRGVWFNYRVRLHNKPKDDTGRPLSDVVYFRSTEVKRQRKVPKRGH